MRKAAFACLVCVCASGAPAAARGGCGGFPPDELVGTWEGISLFSRHGARETARVSLTILPDGRVEGSAGGARMADCVVRRNRGWLGRKLGIKTDYRITGWLEGAVVPADAGGRRRISLPFNLRDGALAGGLAALTQRWWECCPPWLFPRLRLPKKVPAGAGGAGGQ